MKVKKHNIAITGANGYLGSCISNFLANKNYIYKLTRYPKKKNKNEFLFNLKNSVPINFFKQNKISVLIHCAHDFKETLYKKSYEVNVLPSLQLFKNASTAGVKKIVFISSMASHYKNNSVYSRIKRDIEKITIKCDGIIIKPSIIVGVKPGGIFKTINNIVKKFYLIPLISSNNKTLYTVNDLELCKVIKRMIFYNKYKNNKFIVTNKHPTNLKEIFLFLKRKNKSKNIFIPINWRILWIIIKFFELFFHFPIRSDSIRTLVSTIRLNNYTNYKVLLTSKRF